MDPDLPRSSSPRKVRFSPRRPTTRKGTPVPKRAIEAGSDDDEENKEALLRKLDDNLKRGRTRAGKKSSVQVTFSGGVASGGAKEAHSGIKSSGKVSKYPDADTCQDVLSLPTESSQNAAGSSSSKTKKKEYEEPWDHQTCYCPISLPLRKPGSGDPEILDKEEFGGNEEAQDCDESTMNSASLLGLTEEDVNAKMMMFMFPADLPVGHRRPGASLNQASSLFKLPADASYGSDSKPGGKTASSKGKEAKGKETAPVDTNQLLPAHMGKMLVYKSGKVKMKLGDVLYDVSPGVERALAQEVAVMNTVDRECCVLGEMGKVAVVTPEFDDLNKI